MKNLLLSAVLLTLPLLLGGCGDPKDVTDVKNVEEKVLEVKEEVNYKELEISGNLFNEIAYHKGSPYTGKSINYYVNGKKQSEGSYKDGQNDGLTTIWYTNGQKQIERHYKDGKEDGLVVAWHENGQKAMEGMVENGKEVSQKFWNNKGESVNSFEETGLNKPQ